MKVIVAPDKFRDALDADAAAAAMVAGVRVALPGTEVVTCPLADGGEGTGYLLARVLRADERTATVDDPLGRPRRASWWLCPDDRTGIIEMAAASGLALLAPSERNALRTSSSGTGQLLAAALDAGCEHILLCVGGSATVDGGAGCLVGLGWELIDHAGATIVEPVSGGMLQRVAELRPPAAAMHADIEILCDVDNPLLGVRGGAPVFGPQKGADSAGVRELERGLAHWADVLERCLGVDVRALAGGGAAGGLPAGLAAALGARIVPGLDEVARRVGFPEQLANCDLCLTGEGRLDGQTAGGKVVAGVARLAAERGVPVLALVGAVGLKAGQTIEDLARAVGVERIVVITLPGTPLTYALATTADNLRQAAREALLSRG